MHTATHIHDKADSRDVWAICYGNRELPGAETPAERAARMSSVNELAKRRGGPWKYTSSDQPRRRLRLRVPVSAILFTLTFGVMMFGGF